MGYLLGVDVGTTNTKAVVYDSAIGRAVAVASRPTLSHHPRPEWTEVEPTEIWRGVVESVREATAGLVGDVSAVAVASMAEAGTPLDSLGRDLYPMIAWHDPRTQPQAQRWHDLIGAERHFAITGQSIAAKYSLNKILWLRENEAAVWSQARKWVCVEDFVNWRLSGEFATDYSIASRTIAFDQTTLDWSPEMLRLADVSADLFPRAHPSGTVVGAITAEAAAATGLRAGTPVVTGGHDHLCGSLSAGIVGSGALLESMGTAEACLLIADRFEPSERLLRGGYCTYAHVVRGTYVVMFGLNSSGGLVEWLVTKLWGEGTGSDVRARAFALGAEAASAVRPGSDGAFWLPHLSGVSTPWNDERARAALFGLTGAHTPGHLYRALLEGLGYWLRENVEFLAAEVGLPLGDRIIAIGGGTRNALWMRTKADITGRVVSVVDVPEATALGAALLAGIGIGEFADAAAAAASVDRSSTDYEPDAASHSAYTRYYERVYRLLYPALREVGARIAEEFGPAR